VIYINYKFKTFKIIIKNVLKNGGFTAKKERERKQ